MASVYSMTKPKRSGSLAKRSTSSASSRNRANSFSNSLSHGTRLKTHLLALSVLRDQGNFGVSDSDRPTFSSVGSSS